MNKLSLRTTPQKNSSEHIEKRITINAQTLKILLKRNFRKVCTVNGKQFN